MYVDPEIEQREARETAEVESWTEPAPECDACGHDPHPGMQMMMTGVCPDCPDCRDDYCSSCGYRKDLHGQGLRATELGCPDEFEAQQRWGL